ncbi:MULTISPECIES: hypothetical protein [unclassified Bradyrhizobium]|uniref:hypothetical protein n=1 Tax=unclassified Bradyrhizobium TaxID=2631580 RepID=UPI0028EB30D8|nr:MULTISPECIES: hypothetical protein [unclassified Bradyrhizobium]
MAMKSTVVIVAVSLALAILLAASLVIAIERRGELSLWPLSDGPVVQVRAAEPPTQQTSEPD